MKSESTRGFDWKQMEEIYHAALAVDIPQRHAFVTERSNGDVVLRDEVLSLLASDNLVADFLQKPVVELSVTALAGETLRETEIMSQPNLQSSLDLTGQLLAGRYKVARKLGGGGFGDVFKAFDTKVMSRPVVIKVLKDEVFQEENVKRDWLITKFRQEIEALSKIRASFGSLMPILYQVADPISSWSLWRARISDSSSKMLNPSGPSFPVFHFRMWPRS